MKRRSCGRIVALVIALVCMAGCAAKSGVVVTIAPREETETTPQPTAVVETTLAPTAEPGATPEPTAEPSATPQPTATETPEVSLEGLETWQLLYLEEIAKCVASDGGMLLVIDGDDIPEMMLERDGERYLFSYKEGAEKLSKMSIQGEEFYYRPGEGRFLYGEYNRFFKEEHLFKLEEGKFRSVGIACSKWNEDGGAMYEWDRKRVTAEEYEERYAEFGSGPMSYVALPSAPSLRTRVLEWTDETHPTGRARAGTRLRFDLLEHTDGTATLLDLNGDDIPEMYVREYGSAWLVVYDERTTRTAQASLSDSCVLADPTLSLVLSVVEKDGRRESAVYRVHQERIEKVFVCAQEQEGWTVNGEAVTQVEYKAALAEAFPNEKSAVDLIAQCRDAFDVLDQIGRREY